MNRATFTTPSTKAKNQNFINQIKEITGYSKHKNWNKVATDFSAEHVREIYSVLHDLWPRTSKLEKALPAQTKALKALFLGNLRPETIVQNVNRYALYTDEIMVINPFMCNMDLKPEYNPLIRPHLFLTDTFQLCLLLIRLEPWINQGIVHLIPDPGYLDPVMKQSSWALAEKRLGNFRVEQADMLSDTRHLTLDLLRAIRRQPIETHLNSIQSMFPKNSWENNQELLAELRGLDENDLLSPKTVVDDELIISHGGANLEMGLAICHLTGSFPYTSDRTKWKEITSMKEKLVGEQNTWSPLTQAFQQLEFNFLNNVDTKFVKNLREEERLASFRSFLRKVWRKASKNDEINDSIVHDFEDELMEEYRKAQAEWSKFDLELIKWSGTALATGAGASIATGSLNIFIAGGVCCAASIQLIQSRISRANFRKTIPMSVFVDLVPKTAKK